jgi:hypothetical protein
MKRSRLRHVGVWNKDVPMGWWRCDDDLHRKRLCATLKNNEKTWRLASTCCVDQINDNLQPCIWALKSSGFFFQWQMCLYFAFPQASLKRSSLLMQLLEDCCAELFLDNCMISVVNGKEENDRAWGLVVFVVMRTGWMSNRDGKKHILWENVVIWPQGLSSKSAPLTHQMTSLSTSAIQSWKTASVS